MQYNNLNELGHWISEWAQNENTKSNLSGDFQIFSELISNQHSLNPWHTEQDIVSMLKHLSYLLNEKNIKTWVSGYSHISKQNTKLPVLIKPNINHSFAGIHEWLCCIVTQTPFILKADYNQYQVLKFLTNKLIQFNKNLSELFYINENSKMKPQQFIIYTEKANGSLNQYFNNKKAIIIEPRPTIGIITGNEKSDDYCNLGKDIFLHLGQSSRSLRKLYIPEGFDIKIIIEAMEPFAYVYRNNKYANNYDYHQSVFLMERISFLDNGFLLFKEDLSDEAPTGCLFYEYYTNLQTIIQKYQNSEKTENIICCEELPMKTFKPGTSHLFNLWEYNNKKDLIEFLIS